MKPALKQGKDFLYQLNSLNRNTLTAVTIAIADDHVLFAESLSKLLFSQPEYVLSFAVSSAEGLPQLLQEHQPAVLILDINLPPHNGLQLLPQLREASPATRILLLSMHQPAEFNLRKEEFTGDGYLLKTSGKDVLQQALHTLVYSNNSYFSPDIKWQQGPVQPEEEAFSLLTRREKEISRMISEGKTNREIANELHLSEHTVKTHRSRIREKLQVNGVGQLLSKLHKIQQ